MQIEIRQDEWIQGLEKKRKVYSVLLDFFRNLTNGEYENEIDVKKKLSEWPKAAKLAGIKDNPGRIFLRPDRGRITFFGEEEPFDIGHLAGGRIWKGR